MEEIISMIPSIVIAILIFFFSNYFLKKDKQKDRIDSNPNYISYLNIKAKLGKMISILMIIIIVLKIVWILFLKE